MGRIKVAKTRLIRTWCFGKLTMFLFPSTTFRQVQEVGELVQENPSGTNLIFFKINSTVGVPSTFGFAIFIFQVPERYAYLSGTGKVKCINRNLTKSGTRTCLVQMIKWKEEFRNLISGGSDSDFWNDWMEAVLDVSACFWLVLSQRFDGTMGRWCPSDRMDENVCKLEDLICVRHSIEFYLCGRMDGHSLRAPNVALTCPRYELGKVAFSGMFLKRKNFRGLIFFQVSPHTPKKSRQKNHSTIGISNVVHATQIYQD